MSAPKRSYYTPSSGTTRELLRRLAAHDDGCLQAILSPSVDRRGAAPRALDRETRVLVQLAALLAVGAPTTSVRWAVDRAMAVGARDETLVGVLLTAGAAAGAAQTVISAARLALALDVDPTGANPRAGAIAAARRERTTAPANLRPARGRRPRTAKLRLVSGRRRAPGS